MSFILITDRAGNERRLDAPDGWRVMEILRDYGLGIEGVCDGCCSCATCHVRVAPEWLDRLHPPSDDGLAKLDTLPDADDASRLSCQIIYGPELEGLRLSLPEAA